MKFVSAENKPIIGTAYLFTAPGEAMIRAPQAFVLDADGSVPDEALPTGSQVLQVFKDGRPVTAPVPSWKLLTGKKV